MPSPARSPRTHSRKELAAPRPPIVLGLMVAGAAVMVFLLISRVLG